MKKPKLADNTVIICRTEREHIEICNLFEFTNYMDDRWQRTVKEIHPLGYNLAYHICENTISGWWHDEWYRINKVNWKEVEASTILNNKTSLTFKWY